MDFNINDKVRVRLTYVGRTHLRQPIFVPDVANGFVKLPPRGVPAEVDGWSEWQLWELMEVFGSIISLGSNPPFETTIQIVMKEQA